MIKVILQDYRYYTHELENIISFDICHTLGEPCDYYEISAVYSEDTAAVLPNTVRVEIYKGTDCVFVGVLDEYIVTLSEKGTLITLNGRSLAALLLDRESEAMEYASADIASILRNHVSPCGIEYIAYGSMPAVAGFSVPSGTSQWNVLKRFCRASNGAVPRFSPDGTLILNNAGIRRGTMPTVYGAKIKNTRYGILSSVTVKNRGTGAKYTVQNSTLRGGTCARVVTVPKNTASAAMRSTASYLIEESRKDKSYIEVTTEKHFQMFPGDIMTLNLPALGVSGAHTVTRTRCWANENGAGSVIRLEV